MEDNLCRYESNSGGEREIQRTMLELLNQLDGFDNRTETKVPNWTLCPGNGTYYNVYLSTLDVKGFDVHTHIGGDGNQQDWHIGSCPPQTWQDWQALWVYVASLGQFRNSIFFRKIEFPMPDEKTKRRIFNIHTGFKSECYNDQFANLKKMKLTYSKWLLTLDSEVKIAT